MKRNIIWIAFLGVVTLLALWFVVRAGSSILSYYHLTVQVPTTIEQWTVDEIKSDQFAVNAHFSFEYNGKRYQGSGQVGGLYPNPWAAKRAETQFENQKWPAWINPNHPEKALLVKKFPYKQTISSFILIGLLIYFLFLSSYVKMKHG